MPSAAEFSALGNAAIVAPAGHGKTEVIAGVAALGCRSLILTHTHAGVHAIRSRLKRLGISHFAVSVDTIAGWCMRYAHAFPGIAQPPSGMPRGPEWTQLYRGTILALGVTAIRDVVSSSYDRILIDEYQDCDVLQHELATTLASIVPTVIFGDPMQGIFEFAGATLSWAGQIHPQFPLAGSLDIPYRWQGKNPELGAWIAETRQRRLMVGEPIDLESGPIIYRSSNNAFDMGTFFDGIDAREGTQAAIHCNRALCNRLAQATRGGFQAIEEMAASRLQSFATDWDSSPDQARRLAVVKELINDCFHIKQRLPDEDGDQEDDSLGHEMNIIAHNLGDSDGIIAARQLFSLARRRSRWRLFRGEIWRDGERAMSEIESGRVSTMMDATAIIRQRITNSGRRLPTRTISTPLLLKGLEFDHVVIPDATHFGGERFAHAKLFYVAISRATRSLTISSSERFLQFPVPKI